ncbi:hypothetical protein B566_EDAN015577 [Ephemera danica]|nr:hypothetical protein B566_EDAN015577 [Ephemera danica]
MDLEREGPRSFLAPTHQCRHCRGVKVMVTGGTAMGSSNPVVVVPGSNSATASSMPVESIPSVGRRSSENRRSNKPIMEKRRRARINNCLNELKSLILDAMKKDPARHSKLEKADILEMTVKHLESLQRQQMAMTVAADPAVLNKYRAGFSECATEVGRFLGRGDAPQLDPHVKRRLLAHLSNCLSSVGTSSSSSPPSSPAPTPTSGQADPLPLQVQLPPGISVSSDGQLQASHSVLGSLQLVPTRLPNGDIALVLPSHHTAATAFRSSNSPSSPSPSSSSSASSTASQSPPPPPLAPFSSRVLTVPSAAPTSPMGYAHSLGSVSPRSTVSSACSDMRALSPPMQKPLSLVTRRDSSSASSACDDDEGKPCWRPWSMA